MQADSVSNVSVFVDLVPMTPEQFIAYRLAAEKEYAWNIAASGAMPDPEARTKAQEDFAQLIPQGLSTPNHFFWAAYDGSDEVGMLWISITEKSDGLHAFGYDFAIPKHRRRGGYGRAIMVAAEQLCKERGVVSVGLSVFGFNVPAQALYESMGFEVTSVQMKKRL